VTSRRPQSSARRRLRRRLRRWYRQLRYQPAGRKRIVLWTLGGIIGLGLLWIVVTGLVARSQAEQLESQIAKVRILVSQGRVAEARAAAGSIPSMAARAHRLTTGPAWWVAAHIPYVGEPLDVMRDVFAAADRFGSTIPDFVRVSSLLEPTSLRANGSTIRIAPIVEARPGLLSIKAKLDGAYAQVGHLSGTWLSLVNSRKDQFADELERVRGYVDAAVRASDVLPTMLGQARPQRYFIALQTEAELRGTGGLPGAFTIATAYHGRIHFEQFYSDTKMLPNATHRLIKTGLDFGSDYDKAYGPSGPTDSYLDSNVSPNFPYAAQIWAAMWRKVSGEQVDGVLAIDPTAIAYFLDVMRPITVSGQLVTGANVVDLTERQQYALFPDDAQRKDFEVGVLHAVARELTSGIGNPVALLHATGLSGSQRRLLVWSRDPHVQRVLVDGDFAGAIPRTDQPFSALILNNAASGKLDYYLGRSVQYQRTGCGSSRDVLVTITLVNGAPASGLPAYVTTRLDDHAKQAKPGDNRELLDYYATDGAQLQSITIDGKQSTAGVLQIDGHTVFRLDLELPQGSTKTIVLHLSEPAGHGSPLIWQQPGATPLQLNQSVQKCG
jgi:hypothetical protein